MMCTKCGKIFDGNRCPDCGTVFSTQPALRGSQQSTSSPFQGNQVGTESVAMLLSEKDRTQTHGENALPTWIVGAGIFLLGMTAAGIVLHLLLL